jgi:hypothetical protein
MVKEQKGFFFLIPPRWPRALSGRGFPKSINNSWW